MNRDQAIAVLKTQAAAVKARGATSLYLFGSTGRDSARADSDIDMFIDYDAASRFSLIDLAGIKQFLESRLGAPVDLTTRDSLDPLLRKSIEASATQIF